MKIMVNGREQEFSQLNNLQDLIKKISRDTKHVIAEVNGEIIKTPRWGQTPIKDGDTIELVNVVGGG